MPASPAERLAWRVANADLIEFIQTPANQRASRFIASMSSSYDSYGSLTESQTAATRNVMRELAGERTNEADIAMAEDESPIPNGVFTVNDGTEHLTYRIHSVRNGRLRGQRVIKRQLAYGEFKAFAFLTRQGTVKVWRSFYEDEARNERYIAWARILVEALRERTQDAVEADEIPDFEFTYASGNGYSIQASVLCRRCNRALTDPTSIRLNIGPECRNREQTARTNAANAHEPVPVQPFDQYVPSLRPLADHIQVSADILNQTFPFEEVGAGVASGEQEPPVVPVGDREARLIEAAQRAIDGHLRMNYITNVRSCEYCGRDDFQSPQGRGRHVSSCRTNYRRQNRVERTIRALGEFRAEAGIVRNDDYAMRYLSLAGEPSSQQQPVRFAVRRPGYDRRPPRSSTPVPTVTRPHLSQLGTVIGGRVWEQ